MNLILEILVRKVGKKMDIDHWNDEQKKKYALELHDKLEKAIHGFYLEINDIEIVKRALAQYLINLDPLSPDL